MKLTNELLRDLYLKDLGLPDTHHGRTTPKVKYLGSWKAIQPYCKTGTPLDVIEALDLERDAWVWSDQHFGHKNIITYCNRPYTSADEMTSALIANYLSVVKPNDIVFWGGDIGFMSENKINEILNSLPGYKIHIVGNHDMHRNGVLYKLDVDEQYLCYALTVCDIQILITHYPMDSVPKGCVNLHGHIHDNLTPYSHSINMCVEHTNYTPRNLKDIISDAVSRVNSK